MRLTIDIELAGAAPTLAETEMALRQGMWMWVTTTLWRAKGLRPSDKSPKNLEALRAVSEGVRKSVTVKIVPEGR